MNKIISAIICCGGPTHCITVSGKEHHFELHPFCGLLYCSKDGDERKEPAAKDPFWKAVELWREQGSQEENGKCVYDPDQEVVDILRHLGGRNYEVIGHETVGQRRQRLSGMTPPPER